MLHGDRVLGCTEGVHLASVSHLGTGWDIVCEDFRIEHVLRWKVLLIELFQILRCQLHLLVLRLAITF